MMNAEGMIKMTKRETFIRSVKLISSFGFRRYFDICRSFRHWWIERVDNRVSL
jgi:hypothetical protein